MFETEVKDNYYPPTSITSYRVIGPAAELTKAHFRVCFGKGSSIFGAVRGLMKELASHPLMYLGEVQSGHIPLQACSIPFPQPDKHIRSESQTRTESSVSAGASAALS